jgi:hypothetical protein
MVLHISSRLVFPTPEMLSVDPPTWKPDLLFMCITGILLMIEKMVRPSQVMWNRIRPPYRDHNVLVPEIIIVAEVTSDMGEKQIRKLTALDRRTWPPGQAFGRSYK